MNLSTLTPHRPAVQRRLPIAVETYFLASIEAARKELRTDEDEVMDLIADRQLLAFDLRTPDAGKSFVRIWPGSIDALADARKIGRLVEPLSEAQVDQIMNYLIGTNRAQVRATLLKERWVTSSTHIHNLIEAKLLQSVAGTGDTINKTPMVIRDSVVTFLKSRRLS